MAIQAECFSAYTALIGVGIANDCSASTASAGAIRTYDGIAGRADHVLVVAAFTD